MRGFARSAISRFASFSAVLILAALLAGGSWAATGNRGNSEGAKPEVAASETADAEAQGGEHGGTVERYHGADCTAATGLEGNWTHGDYVSAVAQDDDEATEVADAAQSDCGKPTSALEGGAGQENGNKPASAGTKPAWGKKGGRSADHRADGS